MVGHPVLLLVVLVVLARLGRSSEQEGRLGLYGARCLGSSHAQHSKGDVFLTLLCLFPFDRLLLDLLAGLGDHVLDRVGVLFWRSWLLTVKLLFRFQLFSYLLIYVS